jgi:hypothetical protein
VKRGDKEMLKRPPALIIGLLGLLLMVGGCGESIREYVDYYYPNWLTDGRIMAVKVVEKERQTGIIPGYSRSEKYFHGEYIVSMKDDGSEEREIYGGEDKGINIPAASPLGNYIAYRSGQYINIISADGKSEIKSIDCGEKASSFDWSPDEGKIVFTGDETKDMYIIDIASNSKTKIATSAEAVAWRVGEKIVHSFADYESSKIYAIKSDGSSKEVIAAIGTDPQISNTNKVIYSGYGLQVNQVDISGNNDKLLFDGYQRSSLKLSFDNNKIVGGDWIQGGYEKGVWIVNIDGSGLTKLRN